jgi:uncharacterized protein (DUF2141 family)
MQNVIFKFRQPTGSSEKEPSVALTEALRRLSEAEELTPLLAQARNSGGRVAIEVFRSHQDHHFLIHIAKERKHEDVRQQRKARR